MSEKVKVSREKAKQVLAEAYAAAKSGKTLSCPHQACIDFVLGNTHRTYKYVLVNALLAKAANENINPLCLQKKSELPGAYDARSLCHEVFVPFEKGELGKALGGSNEPFLNKPARFRELNRENAVRAGRDREILCCLCDNLPRIETSSEAFCCLVYALSQLLAVKEKNAKLTDFTLCAADNSLSAAGLYRFINRALYENCEGEMLTLVTAGLYAQFMAGRKNYRVEVHPVNESGASGREISDLDIYWKEKLCIANELKDKAFTDHDLTHAADKAMKAGLSKMNFIVGRYGSCLNAAVLKVTHMYLEKGFLLNVISVDTFAKTMLAMTRKIDCESFLKYILETARETKFKETTIKCVQQTARRCFTFDT